MIQRGASTSPDESLQRLYDYALRSCYFPKDLENRRGEGEESTCNEGSDFRLVSSLRASPWPETVGQDQGEHSARRVRKGPGPGRLRHQAILPRLRR